MLPKAAGLFEKLPRTLRRHRLMKGWMRLTGEDPVQLCAYETMRVAMLI